MIQRDIVAPSKRRFFQSVNPTKRRRTARPNTVHSTLLSFLYYGLEYCIQNASNMQDRLLPQVALYTTGLMHIMLLFVGDRFGKVGRRSLGSSRDVILRVIERGVEEKGKGYNRTDKGIGTYHGSGDGTIL